MLPGTVHARLWKSMLHVPLPSSAARENVVMLAIECSKPDATNASNAHHKTMHLAASLRVRAAIHSPRHTSALHSTARQKSCPPPAASLACTIEPRSVWAGLAFPGVAPIVSAHDWQTAAANAIEPTKLPISELTQTTTRSPIRTSRRTNPWSMVIVLPVKSSAPAKTTRVRATPNTAPCISLLKGDAAVTSGAPTLISSTTATPTYAPASMLAIAYRGRLRAWPALVRASAH